MNRIFLLVIVSLFIVNSISGQKNNKKFVVSGVVTDAQHMPVPAAMILVDMNNTNVITDENGAFKVKVKPTADTITVISMANGVSKVAINGQTTIYISMGKSAIGQQNAASNLKPDETVNIGYGNVKKKDLLTNVSTIDASGGKYARYKNIYEALKGTPGVMVSGTNIKIQGISSMNSGTQPMFIVDGIEVMSVDGISPYSVESISVLKGSAASIYGSRGANGVIIFTLKK
jgi:TonB-dependent SusC/RagA subfamily outer membrane receptor